MQGIKRTDYCGTLTAKDIGREVTLCGWVQRQRDLGALIFVDLRDRTGVVQLAFTESTDKEVFDKAFSVRSEYVLAATGTVRERSAKNPDIPTGEIEIEVKELRVLAKSETTPFEIQENSQTGELTRLKYRYLDLRRPDLQKNIIFRHKVAKITRDYFDENGFIEIETPMLIRSTPEAQEISLFRREFTTAASMRFRSLRSFISSFRWLQALTDICRLPVASEMRT